MTSSELKKSVSGALFGSSNFRVIFAFGILVSSHLKDVSSLFSVGTHAAHVASAMALFISCSGSAAIAAILPRGVSIYIGVIFPLRRAGRCAVV